MPGKTQWKDGIIMSYLYTLTGDVDNKIIYVGGELSFLTVNAILLQTNGIFEVLPIQI